jgi:hypothetical protein
MQLYGAAVWDTEKYVTLSVIRCNVRIKIYNVK